MHKLESVQLAPIQGDSFSHLPPLLGKGDNNEENMENGDAWASDRNKSAISHGLEESRTVQMVNAAGNPKKDPPQDIVLAGSGNTVNTVVPRESIGDMRIPGSKLRFFDYNFHAMKKSISSGLLDVALLMANAAQLKTLYTTNEKAQEVGKKVPFYEAIFTFLIISIVLQIIIGVVLIILSRININDADGKKHSQAEYLNNFVVIAIFLLTIVNIFIAAFGISTPVDSDT